jgi:hypothetical protein
MFDAAWEDSADYRTLFRLDRQVRVDVARIFPPTGTRKDELPLWVKAGGALLEPVMPARQIAWLRRSDGGWIAAVEMPVSSAIARSRLSMQLWRPADAVSAP